MIAGPAPDPVGKEDAVDEVSGGAIDAVAQSFPIDDVRPLPSVQSPRVERGALLIRIGSMWLRF
jgi:hypothetical protein